ncbi:DUF6241 domain-containing protein [Clostridium lacusfryxellense]|uniref:DUF6241 domain-containing protein n=1 Tax=Clostridium lacusfryxellense TaxID=205328 RepID=UPI001C0D7300|nr:DUF6241 domain-containing protein [Clostridium lacusfryxellense]MBU3113090.1 hypothetical protein [Clostridium lacusfryxellense]
MRRLRLKTVIIPIVLICAIVGGVAYFTIVNKIKKENALQVIQINKQKADDKRAEDKRVADAKAIAEAKAIADAKAEEDARVKQEAKVKEEADLKAQEVEEQRVYIKMHEMINSKIVAEDGLKYGVQDITPADCDELLKIVKVNNYADKNTLTTYLNSWKKNDFSNGVAQHNYIWDKLGRGEGKAIGLAK